MSEDHESLRSGVRKNTSSELNIAIRNQYFELPGKNTANCTSLSLSCYIFSYSIKEKDFLLKKDMGS